MIIKQYKAEKGIATPVNHNKKPDPYNGYYDELGKFMDFEHFAEKNQFFTNAQDGVYDADCFKLKWQCYDHDREQWQDAEQSAECTWEKFNEWFRTTRKYLQFIDNPIPKMETTELPSPENKYRVGRRLGTVILTVNGQTEIGRIHDPEMALRVCDFLNKTN